MNDRELALRAWYRAQVPTTTVAPDALRKQVLAIPRTIERPRTILISRRRLTLLAVAALIAVSAALLATGAGSKLLSPPSVSQQPGLESTGPSVGPTPNDTRSPAAAWRSAGSMVGVWGPETQAVALGDGGVLAVGPAHSASRYDPASGTWQGVESSPASPDSLVLLADGTVLAAGGNGTAAQRFDPATGRWTATGGMTVDKNRTTYSATLLADGRVLVAGGVIARDGVPTRTVSSALLYDPATGRWAATDSLSVGRWGHAAALLGDGRVLVVGGMTLTNDGSLEDGPAPSEVYDPERGMWAAASDVDLDLNLSLLRAQFEVVVLPEGSVLAVGNGSGGQAVAELYDPRADRWTVTGDPLVGANGSGTATLLMDGRVLLAGGGFDPATASAELYDPTTRQWTRAATMLTPRDQHAAVLLTDGSVMVCGGERAPLSGNWLSTCDRYTP
jgi:hypothetical protein